MDYIHYIKVDKNNNIIDAFSSWQHKKIDGTEIEIRKSNDRHFNIVLKDMLTDEYLYKFVKNKIVKKKQKELETKTYKKRLILQELQKTDSQLRRAEEDIFNFLVVKNVINKDEISSEIKSAIKQKIELRKNLNSLGE